MEAPVERVGVRELRQALSSVLERVVRGETIEVTDHGHPVARIVPIRHRSQYQQLVAEGRIIPAEDPQRLLQFEPLPPVQGKPLASEILAELRRDER
jgi:prevent-host-death family protein